MGLRGIVIALCAMFLIPTQVLAADGGVCPRPIPGAEVAPPPDLYSQDGVLKAQLNYYTSVDAAGRTLFCFVTPDGNESPTLHVNPGDTLDIAVTNMVPATPGGRASAMSSASDVCGNATMTDTSVNMHFHGTNTAPKCHSDEVIRTLINSGETFDYQVKIPKDEPPGLYWYHPHVHGISSPAVGGGASGAIIVEGIGNLQPAVVGLPERLLIVRDPAFVGTPANTTHNPGDVPFWEISLNYVPVIYPFYRPSIIKMQSGQNEFWRVANASANSILDIHLDYDGVRQPLQIVAFDGVPTGSQDGKRQGTIVTETDILIPPAGRAEFIVTPPSKKIRIARLITEGIDSGPAGDVLPTRPLAQIALTDAPVTLPKEKRTGAPNPQRFEGLERIKPTAKRKLYFSEKFAHASRDGTPPPGEQNVYFFITVDGQKEQVYDPNNPPAITTKQGAVEDWTIENHAAEPHEFHIHQIHFLLLAVNGIPVPPEKRQFYDTYQIDYWDSAGRYPSIKVRMDFRGPVVGDFLYHCHILDHEDGGMMAAIRVLPKD